MIWYMKIFLNRTYQASKKKQNSHIWGCISIWQGYPNNFSLLVSSKRSQYTYRTWYTHPYHYHHHHHHFNVHVLPRIIKSIDGCFPTAKGTKPIFSDLVTIRQLSIHGNVGMSFWWPDVLPGVNQLGLRKRRWNLATFSGSWIYTKNFSMVLR